MSQQPTASSQSFSPSNTRQRRFWRRKPYSAEDDNRELYRVHASWVSGIFPDELIIQEKTVCVIRNTMFVSHAETMPVKDIGRVVCEDRPFFMNIKLIGKNTQHELSIAGLPKKQAQKAKDIVEGLLLVKAGEADIPQYLQTEERRELLKEEGSHEPEGQQPE